jgi:hypothetical protein
LRIVKLYSYVVARDYGFAPNPFFGVCSLATCKPKIRSSAVVDDWIMGTGSRSRGHQDHVVYAMRITEVLNFDQYWSDARFQKKKPNLRGSKKQAFGDNIYHRNATTHRWHQLNSHHSFPDGTPNPANVSVDTGTNRILLSSDFTYWGGAGPVLPKRLRDYGPSHDTVCAGRGHRNRFPIEVVEELIAWIRSLDQSGYSGEPLDWVRSA